MAKSETADPAAETAVSDEQLYAAGFRKRYYLCGHPAYPDPLSVWPPTEENAKRIYDEYVAPTFESYVAALGYTPRRFNGERYTAETWNPRVLVTWEFAGEKVVYTPDGGEL